ncbi:MAG: hypothetical protein C0483_11540 [Pirellula sp.]|nr:hypothetical protein [Pirellula sp.]
MDGDGKLLKAVLLVACGAVAAVFFSRDESPPTPAPSAASSNGTLVRRTPSPIAVDLQPDAIASASQAEQSGAKFLGGITSQPASPIDARPQGRLSAEVATPRGLPASPTLTARAPRDESTDPDRTPLNNLLHAPQLPERYPGADAWPAPEHARTMSPLPDAHPQAQPRPTSSPQNKEGDGVAKLAFGAPVAVPSAGAMTPIASTPFSTISKPGTLQSAPMQPLTTSQSHNLATSPSVDAPPRRFTPVKRHTIRDGDTLVDLAKRYYGDGALASALYDANRGVLRDPELLPIGAVLTIPARELADTSMPAPAAKSETPAARLIPKLEINAFGAPPTAAP